MYSNVPTIVPDAVRPLAVSIPGTEIARDRAPWRGRDGEVYRATDTDLGRDVALKVLPPSVADDAG